MFGFASTKFQLPEHSNENVEVLEKIVGKYSSLPEGWVMMFSAKMQCGGGHAYTIGIGTKDDSEKLTYINPHDSKEILEIKNIKKDENIVRVTSVVICSPQLEAQLLNRCDDDGIIKKKVVSDPENEIKKIMKNHLGQLALLYAIVERNPLHNSDGSNNILEGSTLCSTLSDLLLDVVCENDESLNKDQQNRTVIKKIALKKHIVCDCGILS